MTSRIVEQPHIITETGNTNESSMILSILDSLLPVDRPHTFRIEAPLCTYRSGKCCDPCTLKKNGDFHSLCQKHREKQNAIQRKSDVLRKASISERRRQKRMLKKQQLARQNAA